MSDEPDKFYQAFPLSVRCESQDQIVYVACPRGARFGDVRKTLATILERPFLGVNLAPDTEAPSGSAATPYNGDSLVEGEEAFDDGVISRARILVRNRAGDGWELE